MTLFFFESPGANAATAPNIFLGNIAGLVSGVFFGLYFIFLRHPRSLAKNPALSVFYGNIFIVLLMLPLIWNDPPSQITFSDAGAILFLGVFQIGVPTCCLRTASPPASVRWMPVS